MQDSTSTLELIRRMAARQRGGIADLYQALSIRPDLIEAVQRLLSSGTEIERVMAIVALRKCSEKKSHLVAQTALSDPSARVRAQAALFLKERRAQEAWDVLVAALHDPDEQVQDQVALALAQIDPAHSVEVLRSLITSANISDKLAALSAVAFARLDGLAQEVTAALKDSDPRVRSKATEALASIGEKHLPALSNALTDSDAQVRLSALQALGLDIFHVETGLLIGLLQDPLPQIRLAALNGLRLQGDTLACPHILPLLDDPVQVVRRMVVFTIGQLGCVQARSRLLELITRLKDEEDRVVLSRALGKLGGEQVVAYLQKAMEDPSERIRSQALVDFLSLDFMEAIKLLIQALMYDPGHKVREVAALILGQHDGEHAIPSLIGALQRDSSPIVRSAAARALANTLNEEGIHALQSALQDSDPRVRLAAVRSLGQACSDESIDALQDLFQHEQEPPILAEITAILERKSASLPSGEILNDAARSLFDPTGTNRTATIWLRDPLWYPVSERIIFYNMGAAETVDLEERLQTYRYWVEPGLLHLQKTNTEQELEFTFTVELSSWNHPIFGQQPCYRLLIDGDPFAGDFPASLSAFYTDIS